MLAADEPDPVHVINPAGRSRFLVLADHYGRLVPRSLGTLGVPGAEMDRHIAWDIGAAGVTAGLASLLDAVAICQRYSRLVIDCNRTPGHLTSIPPVSDGTPIPGNAALSAGAAAARRGEIFAPYHAAIAAEIDRRPARPGACVLIAMHSFTPVYGGVVRPWQAGILHDRMPEYGLAVGALLREEGLLVGDNEPYQLSDESDYTIPVHAGRRGLPYVELEVRQDLIASEAGQRAWATLLAKVLPAAWERVATGSPGGQQGR